MDCIDSISTSWDRNRQINMVNTRAKGNRNRRKIIDLLEKQGYRVAIVERTGRFIKEKDMFGLFDLVAINKYGDIKFVQVATNKPHSHKAFKQFRNDYNQSQSDWHEYIPYSIEQYCCIDGGKIKKWEY